MSLLKLKHVKKSFPAKQNPFKLLSPSPNIKVIDDVSFELDDGKVLVLAGESGSGKTTLARLIIGSIIPDSGDIYFLGQNINNNFKKNKNFYSLIQMIHQDPYSSINPYLKVKDIVMEPLKIHNCSLSQHEKENKVREALHKTKLEPIEEILDKYPNMLSGGQRQRVSIARSIVNTPRLIIADEPVSMLDVSIRAEILSLLNDLRNSLNISIIYITHDLATSKLIGDKIGVMFAGNMVEYGDIDEVLKNPLHPYTWMLIDAVSFSSFGSDKYYKSYKTNLSHISPIGCKFYNRCNLSSKDCINDPIQYQHTSEHFVSCFNYKKIQI